MPGRHRSATRSGPHDEDLEAARDLAGDWGRLSRGSVLEAMTAALALRRRGIDDAGDPEMPEGFDLVVVSRDLDNPTAEERLVNAEIEAVLAGTTDLGSLRTGLARPASARLDAARAARDGSLAHERFTVDATADRVVSLYARLAGDAGASAA